MMTVIVMRRIDGDHWRWRIDDADDHDDDDHEHDTLLSILQPTKYQSPQRVVNDYYTTPAGRSQFSSDSTRNSVSQSKGMYSKGMFTATYSAMSRSILVLSIAANPGGWKIRSSPS